MSHTPGPWHIAGDAIYSGTRDAKKGWVNSLQVFPFYDEDRQKGMHGKRHVADEALIAAAPDLLEACKVALGDLLAHGMPLNSSTGKMLTDAIQKATGEPHA